MKTLLFLICILHGLIYGQGVVLNEIMSSNFSTIYDEDIETSDWIELYNSSGGPVDLSGFSLSDDSMLIQKWTFEGKTLQSGEYLLLFASGKDRRALTDNISHWETVIKEGDSWSYKIGEASIPANWIDVSFDDGSWDTGPSGFGYDDGDDGTDLSDQLPVLSVFIRKKFTVDNLNTILSATLHIDYDDGFVAYLNGQEIARGSIGTPGVRPAWDDLADLHHARVDGGILERFDFNIEGLIVEGENTIAIEVHNTSEGSSDMTLIPYLTLGMSQEPQNANGTPPELNFENPLYMHTNFRIDADGEKIYFSNSIGDIIDTISVPDLPVDVSYARDVDGGLPWEKQVPTPGKPNISEFLGIADDITANLANGFYASQILVELNAGSSTIFYTLDGNDPDENSLQYAGPVSITRTTVLKARAYKSNYAPGQIVYLSYLINEQTDLPVISLSTPPDFLFDENIGIYADGPDVDREVDENPYFKANFWKDWERPAHIEFFDDTRSLGWSENCGIAIYGAWSRAHDQKSMSVKFRSKYGAAKLEYPLFPNLDINEYQSFVIRNSGNDWPGSMLRDAYMQYLVKDLDVDYLEYRPAVLFINGEYWGMMNIREKISEHYVAYHHDVNPDNIDMLENNKSVVHGDADNYQQILDYIQNSPMTSDKDYYYIANRIDLPEMMTYFATQIYINNRDWPGNNIKYWRERAENSKWRWILYDTDFGFNMYGDNDQNLNTLTFALTTDGDPWPNPNWATLLLRRLLLNPRIRTLFINQLADMMNTVFEPNTAIGLLNSLNNHISNEIPNHLARWGQSEDNRNFHLDRIRNFAEQRPVYMTNFISDYWSLGGTRTITIDANAGGKVKISSLYFDENNLPWSGNYFRYNDVTLKAIPADGYKFDGWGGTITAPDPVITFGPNTTYNLTATFSADNNTPIANDIVINEINYNSSDLFYTGDWVELYNGSDHSINLDGWIFSDEQLNTYVIPAGTFISANSYLLLVANDSAFTSRYPEISNYLAPIGFSLDGGGEFIKLADEEEQIIDSLTYDDEFPWPSQADGGGATLELLDPEADNAVASNWKASSGYGTPGKNNQITGINSQSVIPGEFKLYQNYPNPFNGSTSIQFSLEKKNLVDISVYDITGKLVLKKDAKTYTAGSHIFRITVDNLASGVYFYQIQLNHRIADTKKMILIR